jgi:hypothetical protein
MMLEEIRYQMNTYEEKREKLALLLIDLDQKLRSLNEQANMPDGHYNGYLFSFEIIDRVVVEAYAIMKGHLDIFDALESIKSRFMSLNADKQQMFDYLTLSYPDEGEVAIRMEQIETSLEKNFGIVNPYKTQS